MLYDISDYYHEIDDDKLEIYGPDLKKIKLDSWEAQDYIAHHADKLIEEFKEAAADYTEWYSDLERLFLETPEMNTEYVMEKREFTGDPPSNPKYLEQYEEKKQKFYEGKKRRLNALDNMHDDHKAASFALHRVIKDATNADYGHDVKVSRDLRKCLVWFEVPTEEWFTTEEYAEFDEENFRLRIKKVAKAQARLLAIRAVCSFAFRSIGEIFRAHNGIELVVIVGYDIDRYKVEFPCFSCYMTRDIWKDVPLYGLDQKDPLEMLDKHIPHRAEFTKNNSFKAIKPHASIPLFNTWEEKRKKKKEKVRRQKSHKGKSTQ